MGELAAVMKADLERAHESQPDVGVVMPVYVQVHDYLRAALRTILAQSYPNYLFVIVIDGAPGDILEIVREETKDDARVEIVVKPENEGVSKALNTGFDRLMKVGSIEYLTWVSSDNLYHPHFLAKLRDALIQTPDDVGLAYSSFRYIDPAGNLKPMDFVAFRNYQNQPKANLIEAGFVGVSFMYKKKYAASIAGYTMEPVEDFDYWLRLTEQCDIRYVPEELMDFRENAPLSVSLRIHSSKAEHRRWRYMFNLSRQEARTRRGIPAETTVIFPLKRGTESTLDELEALLSQEYSNYALWIVDLGLDPSFLVQLREVEDPRISYRSMQAGEMAAIRELMPHVQTPFTLLFKAGRLPRHPEALGRMRTVQSNGSNGESQPVAVKKSPSWQDSVFGELYRTSQLRAILSAQRRDLRAILARPFRRRSVDR